MAIVSNVNKQMGDKSPNTPNGEVKKKDGFICCLCHKKSYGWGEHRKYGNNPRPVKQRGECCDNCNNMIVIPARIANLYIIEADKVKSHAELLKGRSEEHTSELQSLS